MNLSYSLMVLIGLSYLLRLKLFGRKCKHVVGRKDFSHEGFQHAIDLAKQLNNLINKDVK